MWKFLEKKVVRERAQLSFEIDHTQDKIENALQIKDKDIKELSRKLALAHKMYPRKTEVVQYMWENLSERELIYLLTQYMGLMERESAKEALVKTLFKRFGGHDDD